MGSVLMSAWTGHHHDFVEVEEEVPNHCKPYMTVSKAARKIVAAKSFDRFITFVIMFAAIVVGVETDGAYNNNPRISYFLHQTNNVVLYIFTFEAVLKVRCVGFKNGVHDPNVSQIVSFGQKPAEYFKSGWNTFDICGNSDSQ